MVEEGSVLALVESMALRQLRDGGSSESGGVDGFEQCQLSGEAFMPARAVGGSLPCLKKM